MKILFILLFLCSVCYAAERENIQVDENWIPTDTRYFMCNFYAKNPKTILTKVKGVEFEMCNLYGCEVDETNELKRSNVVDTTPRPPEKTPDERIKQLEDFITFNGLSVPK